MLFVLTPIKYFRGQNVDEGSARDPNGFEIFEYSFPGSPNPKYV